MHWQWFERLPPSRLTEFGGHPEQAPEPIAILYVDAKHAVHSPPSGPVYPWLHLQLARVPLPTAEYEYDGHAVYILQE